ncbi:cuticle collagen 14-like [Sapajus apella]|uniref:Cuticle collagen 14-like n=1 Tax=Sapajus apella TaxID=9515 RepID=A0A6J3GD94_SAPAP|nr:cuticle collagen 14-like [Sapajus apella]
MGRSTERAALRRARRPRGFPCVCAVWPSWGAGLRHLLRDPCGAARVRGRRVRPFPAVSPAGLAAGAGLQPSEGGPGAPPTASGDSGGARRGNPPVPFLPGKRAGPGSPEERARGASGHPCGHRARPSRPSQKGVHSRLARL